ncbi:MAG: hypothetical protein ACTHKR_07570 [Sphingomonas sp.]
MRDDYDHCRPRPSTFAPLRGAIPPPATNRVIFGHEPLRGSALVSPAIRKRGRPKNRATPLNRSRRREATRASDYIAFDAFADIVSFDIIESFDMVSFAIMASLPIELSTAVMLSSIVPMSSVEFMSVTMVLSVAVSDLWPQAETISAAPAIIEPVTTLAMSARI